ncbi:hypothetical protein O4_65 [Pseudomonas phage O4]|uniref:hypothetical protein n=1 Tax=Pseudomonas phage O4 TaxID=1784982 RepID=UPI00078C7B8D|nr:hypothetical protein BJD45_gp65 [Pseudomonas phage O4]AMO43540.1 hypothetical protein O4_65 [Pseudomonas phage O4]
MKFLVCFFLFVFSMLMLTAFLVKGRIEAMEAEGEYVGGNIFRYNDREMGIVCYRVREEALSCVRNR